MRLQAATLGLSMNEYVSRVMRAATDPGYAQNPAEQVRERLRQAGLLADTTELAEAVAFDDVTGDGLDPDEVEAARQRAGQGYPLSDIVADNR